MVDVNISPNANVQTTYDYTRGRGELGERPIANVYQDRPKENCILTERDVYQVDAITWTTSNAGDDVAVTFDGITVPFKAGVDVTATAAAAKIAVDTAKAGDNLLSTVITSAIAAFGVLTVTRKLYGPHLTGTVNTAGTAAAVTPATVGSAAVRGKAGLFVAFAPVQGDPTIKRARMPASASDKLIGVISRGPYPNHQVPPNQYGLAVDEAWPERTIMSVWEKAEVHVRTFSDVAAGDPVYVLYSPVSRRGYAVNSDQSSAGTSQVNDLVVTASATNTVGFHFTVNGEVLPSLTSVSVDAATDRAALRDKVNNSAAYAELLAQSATIVANKIHLVWLPGIVATFTDDSTGGSADVAEGLTTASTPAVAATAIRKEGAIFTEDRTLAQGSAYVDLG